MKQMKVFDMDRTDIDVEKEWPWTWKWIWIFIWRRHRASCTRRAFQRMWQHEDTETYMNKDQYFETRLRCGCGCRY